MSLKLNSRKKARRNKVAVDADGGLLQSQQLEVAYGNSGIGHKAMSLKLNSGKKARRNKVAVDADGSLLQSRQLEVAYGGIGLENLLSGVRSNDRHMQLVCTAKFLELLSIECDPPIKEVIVPRFVEFLDNDKDTELQAVAAWALAIIALEGIDVVIYHGSVPIFIRLLSSQSNCVREKAVLALGNIAGESPNYRDFLLRHNALEPLLQIFEEGAKHSMLRTATWTLLNFCRGYPQPQFKQTEDALPTLAKLINSSDEEVMTAACWALSYLSDAIDYNIKAVIKKGVCHRLVELLGSPNSPAILPALRTIRNIVAGKDYQTQVIIDCGALPYLRTLLQLNNKTSITKEACRTISNITAGDQDQIQAVIEAGIIDPLVNLLLYPVFEIKEEAAWAISNATSGGNYKQIEKLVDRGCIKPLCYLLLHPNRRIISPSLEGLENILMAGEAAKHKDITKGENRFAEMIEEFGGPENIQEIAKTYEKEVKIRYKATIYQKAVRILETYWFDEKEQQLLYGKSFVYRVNYFEDG